MIANVFSLISRATTTTNKAAINAYHYSDASLCSKCSYVTVSSLLRRCDIGVGKWERCNDVIQRECHYPIMGLKENTMYQFRVCAVNQAGVGRPSKATEPILTSDPLEPSRTTGKSLFTNYKESLLCDTGSIHLYLWSPAFFSSLSLCQWWRWSAGERLWSLKTSWRVSRSQRSWVQTDAVGWRD